MYALSYTSMLMGDECLSYTSMLMGDDCLKLYVYVNGR